MEQKSFFLRVVTLLRKFVKEGADVPERSGLGAVAGIQPIGNHRHRGDDLLNDLMLPFEHLTGFHCGHNHLLLLTGGLQ